MGLITVWLPPAPGWHNQEAFATVFYQIPRLIVASLIAFWCGEFANSYTLARMKLWTGGKMLWTRTVGSTVVGQFVDTIVLVTIGFGGTAPPLTLAILAAPPISARLIYEVVATPGDLRSGRILETQRRPGRLRLSQRLQPVPRRNEVHGQDPAANALGHRARVIYLSQKK